MTTKEEEARGEEVRKVSMIIADTLTNNEVEFGIALMALTMILTKAAIECEIDRDTLMESLDASTKMLYDNEDKLTGGDYVQ
jgi:hypothetical protein